MRTCKSFPSAYNGKVKMLPSDGVTHHPDPELVTQWLKFIGYLIYLIFRHLINCSVRNAKQLLE